MLKKIYIRLNGSSYSIFTVVSFCKMWGKSAIFIFAIKVFEKNVDNINM